MKRIRFSEPVHTARIYVGQNVNDAESHIVRKVSSAENREIEKLILKQGSGALTKLKAAGIYYNSKTRKVYPDEGTQVIEIVASAVTACPKFMRRAKALGRLAARLGSQDSVLVMAECYGHAVDGELVAARGAPRRIGPIKERASRKGR